MTESVSFLFLQRTPLTNYPADKYITSRIRIFIMLALPRITRHSGLGDARSFMRIVWLSYKLLIVNHKVYHHFILALRWQTVGRVKWLFKLLLVFDVEYVVMISNWHSILLWDGYYYLQFHHMCFKGFTQVFSAFWCFAFSTPDVGHLKLSWEEAKKVKTKLDINPLSINVSN